LREGKGIKLYRPWLSERETKKRAANRHTGGEGERLQKGKEGPQKETTSKGVGKGDVLAALEEKSIGFTIEPSTPGGRKDLSFHYTREEEENRD